MEICQNEFKFNVAFVAIVSTLIPSIFIRCHFKVNKSLVHSIEVSLSTIQNSEKRKDFDNCVVCAELLSVIQWFTLWFICGLCSQSLSQTSVSHSDVNNEDLIVADEWMNKKKNDLLSVSLKSPNISMSDC